MIDVAVTCFSDPVFSVYLGSTFICGYGFLLFAWWWWKVGKASETYGYLTFMYATLTWVSANGCYIRWMYVVKSFEEYNAYITSIWWALPMATTIFIFFLIIGRMNQRMWKLYKPWGKFKMFLTKIAAKILEKRRVK